MTEAQTETVVSSYDELAAEYYDSARHPTCANFRQASQTLLQRLTPDLPAERSCEVGAGDSLLAALLASRQRCVSGLLLTDACAGMLQYSRRWQQCGAKLAVAPAAKLPLPDRSLLLLVASLADPYDNDAFWLEVARVLAPGGQCLLTAPSWDWGRRFRSIGQPLELAQFELADGRTVAVRSYLRPPPRQRDLIEGHGLRVLHEEGIVLEAIPAPVSRKLLVLNADDPVVTAYLAGA